MNPKILRIVILLVSILWIAGFLSPLYIHQTGITQIFIKRLYAPVCHQLTDRCLDMGHGHFLVCARCTGIYIGWTLGIGISLSGYVRKARLSSQWLLYAAVPIVLDIIFYHAGLYPYQKSVAFLTGFLTGGIISVFFSLNLETTG